ncbi:MAG: DUF2339 domain-containing protein [Pseudomonadota bacterium]
MELIALIIGIAAIVFGTQARATARRAREEVDELRRDYVSLCDTVARMGLQMDRAGPPATAIPEQAPAAARAPTAAPSVAPAHVPVPVPESEPEPLAQAACVAPPVDEPYEAPPPRDPPRWLVTAREWLVGGNLVAKVGLLILFIGVSFLLKYTAAHVNVPIELRLAGIVLVDIGVLGWAWRIRALRPTISLPVQGTAVAVLMLVTFGAFRLYHLIPGGMAFVLLFLLTAFTCLLAVLQDAPWLAIFGIAGGFATPILASTGGGSHIALFSYYALLNAGVLAIAVLRSWRALNLLGFAFTFAIGTSWGVLRYVPENYLSTQLFLILFVAFYIGIAVAYAHRRAPSLTGYVDGTLVFGTPMLAFGLQVGLVKDMQFGMAFSALALGLAYTALALALANKRERLGLLVEAFGALGLVFGTLAIPLALDGRWTSAAWALEGAGIVWVGLRQNQRLTWMFGLLVQAGAWLSFLGAVSGLDPEQALHSNLWLGFLLLAGAAFLMATQFRKHQQGTSLLASVFLGFATIWLVAGAWTEIFLRTAGTQQANLLVLSAIAAMIGLVLIARRMAWPLASRHAVLVQAVAGLTLLLLGLSQWDWSSTSPDLFDKPIVGALMIAAAAAFSSHAMRRQADPALAQLSPLLLAWSGLWWLGAVAPTLSGWLVTHYQIASTGSVGPDGDLRWAGYMLLLALASPLALRLARRLDWPALRLAAVPVWAGLAGTSVVMLAMLYIDRHLPHGETWAAFAALWLASEWMTGEWARSGAALPERALRALHTVRSGAPWMMIWPVGAHWISRWLAPGTPGDAAMLAEAGWQVSGSWPQFLPAWLMMGAIAWLIQRSRAERWPAAPVADFYRTVLLPLAAAWSLVLVAVWNLTQDGATAPLPYVPLLNPLDVSSCFAMLLALACYRLHHRAGAVPGPRLRLGAALAAYGWFNLALLRTMANYRDIPYQFDKLFASQFVQAALSLTWSLTALLLMRFAATRQLRPVWMCGAALLALVVGKLFLIDLSSVGSIERIVSFLGVGALMLGIGYIAPYPGLSANKEQACEPSAS